MVEAQWRRDAEIARLRRIEEAAEDVKYILDAIGIPLPAPLAADAQEMKDE